ncbi:hypothetical protein [Priestia megaterium]|uniref:hypothetical protein n=1 Tax=Priestia megaterium TaxID=1404 RepID=UPI001128F5CD|nr:hypothetical protein [Priestia megaterium]TPF14151.1 hypothetical protein CBE78_26840 [Priestia megaterium]TPF19514.1 hypothetical protein CBE79_26670 [Priestia megaterium]UPK52913.1 hypothetical protein MT476_27350 [Bacillus sp. H8-1]UPK52963.1 hypothetical protein MT476_27605 [Bacillus sp. H8-1]
MGTFLDGRTSQNASKAGSINVPTSASQVLWGQVGLDVSSANPSLPIRVQFDGTITLKLNFGFINLINAIEIRIVRGTSASDPVVYTDQKTLASVDAGISESLTFSGSDYNPPKGSGFLIYTVFVRNITGSSESDVIRVGPENFNVIAIGN